MFVFSVTFNIGAIDQELATCWQYIIHFSFKGYQIPYSLHVCRGHSTRVTSKFWVRSCESTDLLVLAA